MNLESRYLVLKRADIEKYISLDTQIVLANVAQAIEHHRHDEERPPLECIVIESDWPEYEPTLSALETRVDAVAAAKVDNRHYCNDGYWWEIESPNGTAHCASVGKYDVLLETETFAYRGAAYSQKNKWLTKYNMFCAGN